MQRNRPHLPWTASPPRPRPAASAPAPSPRAGPPRSCCRSCLWSGGCGATSPAVGSTGVETRGPLQPATQLCSAESRRKHRLGEACQERNPAGKLPATSDLNSADTRRPCLAVFNQGRALRQEGWPSGPGRFFADGDGRRVRARTRCRRRPPAVIVSGGGRGRGRLTVWGESR